MDNSNDYTDYVMGYINVLTKLYHGVMYGLTQTRSYGLTERSVWHSGHQLAAQHQQDQGAHCGLEQEETAARRAQPHPY